MTDDTGVAADPSTESTPDGGVDDAPGRRGWDWKKLALAAAIVGAIAAFFALGGHRWLDFGALKENRAALLEFTERNYAGVILGVAAAYIVLTALSLPQAALLTLASGFLLGRWVGTAVVVVAATIGATLAFLAARYLFADTARRKMGPRLQRVAKGFEENAFSYLLFLRLVPVFPFWMVNLVSAFTPVTTRTYVAATFIGIIPGSFVYTNLGRRLATLQSGRDLFDRETLLALALLGLLSLVPIAVKKLRNRPTETAA